MNTCMLDAGVAELVDALDLGSSILGCESSSLSFRTMFLIRTKTLPNLELGYRQAVRHQVLILAFPGSNPGIPANLLFFFKSPLQFINTYLLLLCCLTIYFYWHKKRPIIRSFSSINSFIKHYFALSSPLIAYFNTQFFSGPLLLASFKN